MAELNLKIPTDIVEVDYDDDAPLAYPIPQSLTQSEIELRIDFCAEYAKDNSYVRACARLGYSGAALESVSKKFQVDPYVQRLLSVTTITPDDGDVEKFNQQLISETLKCLRFAMHDFGLDSSSASRVAASGKMMSYLGMDKPQQIEQVVTVKEEAPVFDFTGYTKEELRICREFTNLQRSKAAKPVNE